MNNLFRIQVGKLVRFNANANETTNKYCTITMIAQYCNGNMFTSVQRYSSEWNYNYNYHRHDCPFFLLSRIIVQHTSVLKENPKNLVHRVSFNWGFLTSTTQIINSVLVKVLKCPNLPSPRIFFPPSVIMIDYSW